MGFILSKFRKTKPSIKDTLEKIDTDLRKLSRFQYDTELQQKRIIGRVVIIGAILYLIFIFLAYLWGPRDLSWQETVGWITPFILFPFLLIGVKRLLGWYFNRKIVRNKEKYDSLKKEKQRLLDEVMDKETFKVAKEILEKYAPNHLLPKYLADQQRGSPMSTTPIPRNDAGVRRRSTLTSNATPIPYGGYTPRAIRPYGPSPPGQFLRQPSNTFIRPAIMPAPGSGPRPNIPAITAGPSQGPMMRGPPPPRFMLPPPPVNPQFRTRKTGWLDKLVDYAIGDGPSNRFALICRYCATHNGLATPEDFPYIGYRCVYCRQFNPPRQQRPSAATLPKNTVLIEEMDSTIKSPDASVNDGRGDENDETKDDNQSVNEDTTSKDGDGEERASEAEGDPVVEMPASSTEDLTRSVESLKFESDDIPLIDETLNEEEDTKEEEENSGQDLAKGSPDAKASVESSQDNFGIQSESQDTVVESS